MSEKLWIWSQTTGIKKATQFFVCFPVHVKVVSTILLSIKCAVASCIKKQHTYLI